MSSNPINPNLSDKKSSRRRNPPTPPPTSPLQPPKPQYSPDQLEGAEAFLTLRYGPSIARTLMLTEQSFRNVDTIPSCSPRNPASDAIPSNRRARQELSSSPPPKLQGVAPLPHSPTSSPPPRSPFPQQHSERYRTVREALANSALVNSDSNIHSGGQIFATLRRQNLIVNSDESKHGVEKLRREIEKESSDAAWGRTRRREER